MKTWLVRAAGLALLLGGAACTAGASDTPVPGPARSPTPPTTWTGKVEWVGLSEEGPQVAGVFDWPGPDFGPDGAIIYVETTSTELILHHDPCTSVPGGCGRGSAARRWQRAYPAPPSVLVTLPAGVTGYVQPYGSSVTVTAAGDGTLHWPRP